MLLKPLGGVFEDALVQELYLEWAIVEDEFGRDPAVIHPEKAVTIFPLTMISKTVEDGDHVDAFELFLGVVNLEKGEIQAAGAWWQNARIAS